MSIVLNISLGLSLDLLDALITVSLISLGLIFFLFGHVYHECSSLISLWQICTVP
jgi:hypothetical protein